MKAKYLSMAALALMGALSGCQSDDEATAGFRPANAVSLNFSVGSLQGTTRSNALATDNTQRQFNQGDQIAVSTPDQETVIFQCTSTDEQTWTEAEAGKFLLWTQPALTFSAYYPVTEGTSMDAFTLPADQSSVEKINAADYMTREQLITRPTGDSYIQMTLERRMARVIVNISGFGDQYANNQQTVSNVRIYSQHSAIANSSSTGSSKEITPYTQDDGGAGSTYTALVVPGNSDANSEFITLTDGEDRSLRVKGIPEMEAGKSYTFNLTVGKNKIEVASVTVQDWATGETLAGGQAEEQVADGKLYAEFGTPGGNASYNAETFTYTWSASASNLMNCFTFENGELANYTTLTFTFTENNNDPVRINFLYSDNTNNNSSSGFYSGGQKSITLSEVLSSGKTLSDVKAIRFGGANGTGSCIIKASEMYLE